MKRFGAVVALVLAVGAWATSRSISGTVNTPAVATWVDGSNNEIAPVISIAVDNTIYIDTGTGYLWRVKDVLTNPTADGQSLTGLYYTSANCTGTPYLNLPSWTLPKLVQTGATAGSYYVAGAAAGLSMNSQSLSGSCYPASYGSSDFYSTTGPLTPPSLTAAPWHVESR